MAAPSPSSREKGWWESSRPNPDSERPAPWCCLPEYQRPPGGHRLLVREDSKARRQQQDPTVGRVGGRSWGPRR